MTSETLVTNEEIKKSTEQVEILNISEKIDEVDHFQENLTNICNNLTLVLSTVKNLQTQLKTLQKQHDKQIKSLQKKTSTKKNVNKTPRKPSGIAKPTDITIELCKFLGEKEGTLLARTDVTKRITKYKSDNNLQDPTFRKRILPNEDLSNLLKIKDNEELTYFNLQKFMKYHYTTTDEINK